MILKSQSLRKTRLFLAFLLVAVLLAACGDAAADDFTPPAPMTIPSDHRRDTFEAIWSTVDQYYVYQEMVDWQAAYDYYLTLVLNAPSTARYEELLREMLGLLPADTWGWQTRAERVAQEIEPGLLEGIEGIGAFVSYRAEPEPHLVLLSIVPGSPADLAGLRDHDSIYAIDGVPVSADEGIHAVERVRGPVGTSVTLTVDTPEGPFGDVEIERAAVDFLGNRRFISGFVADSSVVYMRFPRLGYDGLAIDFIAAMQTFTATSLIDGMVLDLRIATTGAGWPLENMLQAFTDGELGVYTTAQGTDPLMIGGLNFLGSQEFPLVVLVGPETRGAPEILAAAIQASGRGTVVGLPTAGDIEGIDQFVMPDGSVLSLAVSSFTDANQQVVGIGGVQPDIRVNAHWDEVTPRNDPVIIMALEVIVAELLGE